MYNRRKGKTTKKHNLREIVDRWDSKDKHKVEQERIMKGKKKKKREVETSWYLGKNYTTNAIPALVTER